VRIVRALPLAFLAGVAALLALRWARIPARFAVHWGLDGRPDRWAERSAAGVLGPLVLGAALLVGLRLTFRWLRPVAERHGKGPEELRVGDGAVLGASYAIAALAGAAAARPLLAGDRPWPVLVGGAFGLLFVPLFVVLAAARRGR
jgi:hypothetical protein